MQQQNQNTTANPKMQQQNQKHSDFCKIKMNNI